MIDDAILGLVRALARRVARRLPPGLRDTLYDDLVNEGVLAILQAAPRFNASRGIKFSTFAYRRALGGMLDFLRWHRRQLGPLNADKSLRILRDETDLTDLRVVDVRPGPFEQAARREEWRIVSRAADAKGRNVLRWTREGYARTAIAARLGLSETRVSQVTARLVALARRAIGAAA